MNYTSRSLCANGIAAVYSMGVFRQVGLYFEGSWIYTHWKEVLMLSAVYTIVMSYNAGNAKCMAEFMSSPGGSSDLQLLVIIRLL
jgi:hypothetical protein